MNTKDILYHLRTEKVSHRTNWLQNLSPDRRYPAGKRAKPTPNVETLKLLSAFFNVSINTLLGSPRQLICQCCGMPLEDSITSKEPDGSFNEDYCMWCYADGTFKYTTKEQLIDVCVTHMATESWPAEQVRAHMEAIVPTLKHWKK